MNGLVLLPKRIVQTIAVERRHYLPNETGGFLIGIRREAHVQVTAMTKQGKGDVAGRTAFERSCPSHARHIHAAWRSSGHFESMVGDWHSHPVSNAQASVLDRAAWRTLAVASKRLVIGLIDAGGPVPRLYFMQEGAQRERSLVLIHEDTEDFVFGATSHGRCSDKSGYRFGYMGGIDGCVLLDLAR